MEFSHVGMITDQPHEGEVFVEATRVWITDFENNPLHVEWLRFEPDSPVTGPVRQQPHRHRHSRQEPPRPTSTR